GGLGDDLDVGLGVEQDGEAGAHHPLVVGDHHPDRHRAPSASPPSSGSAAVTRNSPFPVAPARRWPPSMVARSRMPTRPCPPPGPSPPLPSPAAPAPGGQPPLRTSITRAAWP